MMDEYTDGTVLFMQSDHLGSTRLLTGYPMPSVVECDEYYAYGVTISCGATGYTSHKFMGKERDSESNLDNFGARYYSSQMGRFMTPDWASDPSAVPYAKLTDPQTLNLYAMVSDNPEASADLDGHVPGGITDISSEALSGCGILTAWCGGDAVADAHRRCPKCATQIQNLAQQSAQQQSLKSKALKFLGQHRTAVKVVSNTIVVVTAISGAFDVGASEAAVPEEVAGEAALDTAIDAEGEGADAATSLEQKVSDAQDAYPNKAGRIENHHIAPKYLGGDPNGPTAPLDGAYHQMITNAFRNEVPYGSGPVSPEELQQIMNKVYSQFPLPPGSN